jgi:hypothetical protein
MRGFNLETVRHLPSPRKQRKEKKKVGNFKDYSCKETDEKENYCNK